MRRLQRDAASLLLELLREGYRLELHEGGPGYLRTCQGCGRSFLMSSRVSDEELVEALDHRRLCRSRGNP